MAEIRVYGASDDLLEFDGAISEEFSRYSNPIVGTLTAPNGDGLTVMAYYANSGVWGVGVGPLDEGATLPDWPIRFEDGKQNESSFSATLVIDIPEGTTLKESN